MYIINARSPTNKSHFKVIRNNAFWVFEFLHFDNFLFLGHSLMLYVFQGGSPKKLLFPFLGWEADDKIFEGDDWEVRGVLCLHSPGQVDSRMAWTGIHLLSYSSRVEWSPMQVLLLTDIQLSYSRRVVWSPMQVLPLTGIHLSYSGRVVWSPMQVLLLTGIHFSYSGRVVWSPMQVLPLTGIHLGYSGRVV